ncbi:hypothetical protein Tco_1361483 [Tanacetum coccineum]
MQGRQTHSYMGNFSNGNNHIARQCTQPTKVRNSAWFKDKMLVAQVQDARIALSKERLAILADTGDNVDSGPYKNTFEIEKKELKLKNERLLEHIIYQDVMNIVMHADVKFDNVLPMPNAFFDDNIALEMMKMEYDRLMELLVS